MKTSISAGGVVVNKNTGKIAVTSQGGLSWSLPKGHLNDGEELIDAAKREIWEETGIPVEKLEYIKDLGNYQRYRMGKNNDVDPELDLKTIHVFLFTTDVDELSPTDEHNPEAVWVDKTQVSGKLTFEADQEFFEQIKNKIKIK